MRLQRGSALVTVLLVCSILLVVCMSLGTMAVLNLNLAGSYSVKTQGLLIAEAAVNQLKTELDRAQQSDPGNGVQVDGASRVDLLARFQRPVFPDGSERYPADVLITFDTSRDHYSVDNSYNDAATAGWLDRLSVRRSVPPYTIDLIVGVKLGARTTWYEAVLRRRWPYALCTTGKVTMMGAPTYNLDRRTSTVEPTQINGAVYNLPNVLFTMPTPSPKPGEDIPADQSENIFVEPELIHNLLDVFPNDDSMMSVGGTATVRVQTAPGVLTQPLRIVSSGNLLNGTVDVASSSADVTVYPNNTEVGSVRHDVRPYNIVKNLQNAFTLPDTSDYQTLPLPTPAPGVPFFPQPLPTPNVPQPPQDGDGGSGSPTPAPSASASPSPIPSPSASPLPGGSPAPTPTPTPYFVLYEDLVLQGQRAPDDSSFQYGPNARFKINYDTGNRFVYSSNKRKVYYTGAGIELHDCILFIDGNLDLSSTKATLTTQNVVIPSLRGTNATIVVNGTLLLNNGALDASQEGMVIYCRRLVSAAKGDYRGLIMVQKSAAICPAHPGDVMTIQGGIVCGSSHVYLYALVPSTSPTGEDRLDELHVDLNGLHLWSTHLMYDPKYMKTLNRYGPMEVLTVRQIE